ncbi:MAG: AAC(3) family N-acetyltransferase [Succinivibrio sp.]|nr:AAC(3) family N-acetyltransferase [Succinivibrio sp.]
MANFDYDAYIDGVGDFLNQIVDVASDMFFIKMYCRRHNLAFDENELIDKLKEAVGPEGTLMIRAFNWDFCKGVPFDIRKTPSQTGSLGNVALERSDFLRTKHPLYSWLVYGRYQEFLCSTDPENSFGEGSIFDFLCANKAKLLTVGNTSVSGFSHFHHAEQLAKVPYRYHKFFIADYIDYEGNCSKKRYTMYVRRLDIPNNNNTTELESCFEPRGIRRNFLYDGYLRCMLTDIAPAVEIAIDELTNNFGRKTIYIEDHMGFENFPERHERFENEC